MSSGLRSYFLHQKWHPETWEKNGLGGPLVPPPNGRRAGDEQRDLIALTNLLTSTSAVLKRWRSKVCGCNEANIPIMKKDVMLISPAECLFLRTTVEGALRAEQAASQLKTATVILLNNDDKWTWASVEGLCPVPEITPANMPTSCPWMVDAVDAVKKSHLVKVQRERVPFKTWQDAYDFVASKGATQVVHQIAWEKFGVPYKIKELLTIKKTLLDKCAPTSKSIQGKVPDFVIDTYADIHEALTAANSQPFPIQYLSKHHSGLPGFDDVVMRIGGGQERVDILSAISKNDTKHLSADAFLGAGGEAKILGTVFVCLELITEIGEFSDSKTQTVLTTAANTSENDVQKTVRNAIANKLTTLSRDAANAEEKKIASASATQKAKRDAAANTSTLVVANSKDGAASGGVMGDGDSVICDTALDGALESAYQAMTRAALVLDSYCHVLISYESPLALLMHKSPTFADFCKKRNDKDKADQEKQQDQAKQTTTKKRKKSVILTQLEAFIETLKFKLKLWNFNSGILKSHCSPSLGEQR